MGIPGLVALGVVFVALGFVFRKRGADRAAARAGTLTFALFELAGALFLIAALITALRG
ncbi:hypothetical protein [Aurantiacibacter spongiae]|uniref:hypothetical protein n=1 Tax=Aurantiacibacter spongiae TaxID=2488860 RepID=UPI0013152150|nr:hypothetical protein [Aurantiacibacter spongiae]